jgi:hypothetical protein
MLAFQAAGVEGGDTSTIVPLTNAHAHNDYEHSRPLLDALAQGFCSIEADVHLVKGKLLVAHDLKDAKPERTLEALYLEPLRQRARQNGARIYRDGPVITLLVDVKSEAVPTYLALDTLLKHYADIFTRFESDRTEPKAVMAIISGNRAREVMAQQGTRYAALDGRLPDLQLSQPASLVPLISDNWRTHFQWLGEGAWSAAEEQKLRTIVMTAHKQGRKVRFWGTPDRVEVWSALAKAGVDLINTDDLSGLRAFLLRNATAAEPHR